MSLLSTYARLKTALFSGKKSAYFGMFVLAASPITKVMDSIFSKKKYQDQNLGPAILIVCPPRTGGTIVFQVLSHLIPSIYLSNAHQLFPYSGTKKLLKKRLRTSNKINLDNFFGYSYGLNGVNEGNDLIGAIYKNGKNGIRKEFIKFYNRIIGNNDLPLIFKNVRHYEHLKDLCDAVPELKIIRVKRNLEQAAQSEFLAFKKLKYFHPIPKNIAHLYQKISPHEFAVKQMVEMNRHIEKALTNIDHSRYIEIEYEDFCKRPMYYATRVMKDFCQGKVDELRKEEFPLKASFSRKIDPSDAAKIAQFLKESNHG